MENLNNDTRELIQLQELFYNQKYPEALKLAVELENTYPAEAFYYRGIIEFKLGKWEDSLSHLLEAAEAALSQTTSLTSS